jgi:hypothetical protein
VLVPSDLMCNDMAISWRGKVIGLGAETRSPFWQGDGTTHENGQQ